MVFGISVFEKHRLYYSVHTRMQFSLPFQIDAEACTQSSVPCLTDLPTEIILHIFSWLLKGDLINVATVCRFHVISN